MSEEWVELKLDSKRKVVLPRREMVNLAQRVFPACWLPTVRVESISPRDLKPDPDARSKWQQEIFIRRATRFKATW